jgi:hypothetical protein
MRVTAPLYNYISTHQLPAAACLAKNSQNLLRPLKLAKKIEEGKALTMDTNGVPDGGSTQGKPIKCKGSSPNHSIPIIFFSSFSPLLTVNG